MIIRYLDPWGVVECRAAILLYRTLRTHIFKPLGAKTILYKAFWAILMPRVRNHKSELGYFDAQGLESQV